jgi:hypothetical protein
LKKKLRGKCPCGYVFDTFGDEKAALVEVRLHFESFHKDFLPFGITNTEALALFKKGIEHGKPKNFMRDFSNITENPPVA